MAAPAAHASIHDLIAHLAGLGARRVAADSSAVQDAAGEFGISRDQGQQYRSAHARAECGLVVGGADHGGRARDARTQDVCQGYPLRFW